MSGVFVHLGMAFEFVAAGGVLTGLHPLFANRGYQHGRVVLISMYTAFMSMGTGVLIGYSVLDEAVCAVATRTQGLSAKMLPDEWQTLAAACPHNRSDCTRRSGLRCHS